MSDTDAEMVDLQFALWGEAVPHDYAEPLWQAVRAELPWLADDALAGLHPLYGLSPGDTVWYLSRRSRLTLRLPRTHLTEARSLDGRELLLGEHRVRLATASERALAHAPVIYSRFVSFGLRPDGAPIGEGEFLAHCQQAFAALGMAPRLVCGKPQRAATAAGLLSGFSLLVTGLEPEDNLRLQRLGLGCERLRGCGIFVPHKSMAAVTGME